MSEVQMIAVRYPYAGSVGELAKEVAAASTLSVLSLPAEKVSVWLSGKFTKSVRRVREGAKFEKLASLDDSFLFENSLVFPPAKYEDLPKVLSKTQLFKEDLIVKDEVSKGAPLNVYVNRDLGMSSGKIAAQVSHAVLAWHLKHGEKDLVDFSIRFVSEDSFNERAFSKAKKAVLIVDAGLTEIPSNTATVLAEAI